MALASCPPVSFSIDGGTSKLSPNGHRTRFLVVAIRSHQILASASASICELARTICWAWAFTTRTVSLESQNPSRRGYRDIRAIAFCLMGREGELYAARKSEPRREVLVLKCGVRSLMLSLSGWMRCSAWKMMSWYFLSISEQVLANSEKASDRIFSTRTARWSISSDGSTGEKSHIKLSSFCVHAIICELFSMNCCPVGYEYCLLASMLFLASNMATDMVSRAYLAWSTEVKNSGCMHPPVFFRASNSVLRPIKSAGSMNVTAWTPRDKSCGANSFTHPIAEAIPRALCAWISSRSFNPALRCIIAEALVIGLVNQILWIQIVKEFNAILVKALSKGFMHGMHWLSKGGKLCKKGLTGFLSGCQMI